jgi:hypothetical protein
MTERRFPPPWSVDELEARFVVMDSAGQDTRFQCARIFPFRFWGCIAVRAFLSLLIGAVLLGGCAAKPTAGGTTANAAKPTISDGSKSMTSESSPSLSASEDYERAVANYSDCVLDHTANLPACEKQRAIMDRLGKVSSRSSLSQSYTPGNTQINNTTGIAQGANTTNTPQTTSSLPTRTPPTIPEAAEAKPPDARSTPTPTPY